MKITIPFKTLSVNHLYGQRGFMKYLTKEAKELKKEIHKLVEETQKEEKLLIKSKNLQQIEWDKDTKFRVIVEVYEDWFTKKGDIRRCDVGNREKFLIDSIFDKLKVDDRQIFELTMRKMPLDSDEQEKSVITILELK